MENPTARHTAIAWLFCATSIAGMLLNIVPLVIASQDSQCDKVAIAL